MHGVALSGNMMMMMMTVILIILTWAMHSLPCQSMDMQPVSGESDDQIAILNTGYNIIRLQC